MQTKASRVSRNTLRIAMLVGLFSIVVFALYQVINVVQYSDKAYEDIKLLGITSGALMPVDLISQLDANPLDTKKFQYGIVKGMLKSTVSANEKLAFAYLLTIRNGKMYFMADSEPVGSDNYSPPGQIYEEATALDLTLMNADAKPTIERSSDRWGNWVSILIPLKDPSGKNIAVFGLDFNAKEWQDRRLYHIAMALLVILLSLTAFVFILVIMHKSRSLSREVDKLMETERALLLARDRAEENNRLKTAFLKNISHEVRTPLNAIMGFASLLEEDDVNVETRTMYLKHLIRSSDRLLNTIGDIIEISQLQSGQIVVREENVNLCDLVHRAMKLYSPIALEQGLEFRFNTCESKTPIIVRTDPNLLLSILKKLLSNAFKFTSKGFVELKCQFKDDLIEFNVVDSGIGIESSKFPFIFDDFRQASESSSRQYDGNGLGLTIARGLVNKLGGSMKVSSHIGIGSTFTFTIPLKQTTETSIDQSRADTNLSEV